MLNWKRQVKTMHMSITSLYVWYKIITLRYENYTVSFSAPLVHT